MRKQNDLNKLTVVELKKELEQLEKKKKVVTTKQEGAWIIGENYFIRTVTMNLTGKLVMVFPEELVLESASWIADTGRFSQFVNEGKLDSSSEVEPFPEGRVILGRGSVIDAMVWPHELPRKQK